MTLKNVIDFCYASSPVIEVRIEMSGGMHGKTHVYDYNQAREFIKDCEDAEAAVMDFELYNRWNGATTNKLNYPRLYVSYISPIE